jgi:hypothetical protein
MVDTVRGFGPGEKSVADTASKSGIARGRSAGSDRKTHKVDDDTRLMEKAIRAATPIAEETKAGDPSENTRRITGRLGTQLGRAGAAAPDVKREPRQPSSRDLSTAFDDDDEGIGDTAAARELLKALGSVK